MLSVTSVIFLTQSLSIFCLLRLPLSLAPFVSPSFSLYANSQCSQALLSLSCEWISPIVFVVIQITLAGSMHKAWEAQPDVASQPGESRKVPRGSWIVCELYQLAWLSVPIAIIWMCSSPLPFFF